MDVAQSAAYLDAQYTALTGRIQALDAEIAGLEDDKAAAEGDEAQQQAIQAQIDAKRAEQAGYQKILDDNAPRRARLTELNGCLTTLSTTSTALNNATVLLQARQQAEAGLNEGMKPLQQTLNETVQALNDQLTKAQEILTQLNDQRAKMEKAWVTPPWTPPWPMWPCSCF